MKANPARFRKRAIRAGLAVLLGGLALYAWNVRYRWQGMPTDAQRVQGVLGLSWRIALYAHTRGALPVRLADLDGDGAWKLRTDPATAAPYAYEVLGRETFRLRADFSSASAPEAGPRGTVRYGDPVVHGFGQWAHGKGRQCLVRKMALR